MFQTVEVSSSGPISLPPGNASLIVLARVPRGQGIELRLPPAASSVSRFVTIRRLDARGRVLVRAAAGEGIEGGREVREGRNRDSDTLALENRWDSVTLVSDGTNWFVFSEQR